MNQEKYVGQALVRRDGPLKVNGGAHYSGDLHLPNMAYGVAVGSTQASGKIRSIDSAAILRLPGVLLVLTSENVPKLGKNPTMMGGGSNGEDRQPLEDNVIHHAGQIVAVVVGDTLEHAQAGADQLRIDYDILPPLTRASYGQPAVATNFGRPYPMRRGEAEAAVKAADVKLEATYSTPLMHHNPIETHATTAYWENGKLTVYDATQNNFGTRKGLAVALGIDPKQVRVICKFIGGAFGCKGSMWSHVALTAVAAKMVKRPVRLQLTRPQMFTSVGHRAHTEQKVAFGCSRDGHVQGCLHTGLNTTSMIGSFTETFTVVTPMLYSFPSTLVDQKLVRLNTGTPTFMRAPGETPGSFALESAMDELAHQLALDPVELRLRNYAEKDFEKNLPWSSKTLRECYAIGAEKIGWSQRSSKPGQRRQGDWLIGLGMATATYPANHFPASCGARFTADGKLLFRAGTHEMGTGTVTVMAQLGADTMAYPLEKTHFELGDTDLPMAPVSGGSATAGSVGSALYEAALALKKKFLDLAAPHFPGASVDALECGRGAVFLKANPHKRVAWTELALQNGGRVETLAEVKQFGSPDYSKHGFGAQFAEVRVDPDLGIIRLNRFAGVYACGRILNRKTANSQMRGGITMGIGMALMEESRLDAQSGRYLKPNLAGYHVPSNADSPQLDITLLDEKDSYVNPVGTKGIGEIGITGVAAALANAVFNATGVRLRNLPMTPANFLRNA